MKIGIDSRVLNGFSSKTDSRAAAPLRDVVGVYWSGVDSFLGDLNRGLEFLGSTVLATNSAKLNKGTSAGDRYITNGIYLPPASSGRMLLGDKVSKNWTLCPSATPGCKAACLGIGSGQMNQGAERVALGNFDWDLSNVQRAQAKRLKLFIFDVEAFKAVWVFELHRFQISAMKTGRTAAHRPNCTSDTPWERIFPEIFTMFPGIKFYDYTKIIGRIVRDGELVKLPANYHLTFSRADGPKSHDNAARVLAAGGNVAAVFSTQRKGVKGPDGVVLKVDADLPSTWEVNGQEYNVLDGDLDDAIFLDAPGWVRGLRAKGLAKSDATGFVIEVPKAAA